MSEPAIVIVADPDRRVRDALRVSLSGKHAIVLLAGDADELEGFARQTRARMIVLDVTGAKLTGYSTCARLRHRLGYATQPIVLTAADVRQQDMAAAREAGATVLLNKPYSIDGLRQAVAPYLAVDDPLWSSFPKMPASPMMDWRAADAATAARNPIPSDNLQPRLLSIVRGGGVRLPVLKMT